MLSFFKFFAHICLSLSVQSDQESSFIFKHVMHELGIQPSQCSSCHPEGCMGSINISSDLKECVVFIQKMICLFFLFGSYSENRNCIYVCQGRYIIRNISINGYLHGRMYVVIMLILLRIFRNLKDDLS